MLVARKVGYLLGASLLLALPAASAGTLPAADLDLVLVESVPVEVPAPVPPDTAPAPAPRAPLPDVLAPELGPVPRLVRWDRLAGEAPPVVVPIDVVDVLDGMPDVLAPVVVPPLPVAPAPAPLPATAPVAVAAGAAGSTLLTLLLAPLYTRLAKGAALENPTRRRVYEAIVAAPGAAPSDLMASLALANGALLHHLAVLEREGLVTRVASGRSVRCFAAGRHSFGDMRARAVVLAGSAGRVLDVVKARPGVPVREAALAVGISVSAVHRSLDKLEEVGLVERRRVGKAQQVFPVAA